MENRELPATTEELSLFKRIMQDPSLRDAARLCLQSRIKRETEILHEAAVLALSNPSLRESALRQLGKVMAFKDIENFINFVLKEQNRGRQRIC